jgi:4-amino-4-deoxy-L-arabinose transferase-like glycosyltransferase
VKTKTKIAAVAAEDKSQKEKERKTRLLIALLSVALSGLAVVPFFFMGQTNSDSGGLELKMPATHDMHLHYEQMRSFYHGLSAGAVYPRWEEDTNRGFGAPTMSYYPPGVYYITSLFYAMSGDWIRALLNTHLLMMLASAAAIYVYARRFMSRFAAVTAMAAYIFLPYHLLDQYQRGAIAELLGFIWMPLMLLFGERLFRQSQPDEQSEIKKTSKRSPTSQLLLNLAGLGVSYGAFIWSHPPTAYQFTLAFGVYLITLAWIRRDFKGLVYAGLSVILGLAVSAAYLYPAAIEQELIRHEYISETWPYHNTYVFVHDLYYIDSHHPFFRLIDSIWIFGTILIAVCAVLLLTTKLYSRLLKPALEERVLLWVILGGFATFMMTKLSYPIGRFIPKIDIGVFTWRMLSITTLVLALLAGACVQAAINAAKERQSARRLVFSSLAAVIAIGGILFGVGIVALPVFRAPVFVPSLEHVNFATIPRTASEEMFALPVVDPAELAGGKGEIFIERWDPHHRALRAELSEPDRLMIRTFDFPGWKVTVDGQPAEITHGLATRIKLSENTESITINGRERAVGMNEDFEALVRANGPNKDTILANGQPVEVVGTEQLGDILLELPAGTHQVKLDFTDTSPRRIANLTTVIASFLVVAIMIAAVLLGRSRQKD